MGNTYFVTERFSTHTWCWKTKKVFYQLCNIFSLGLYGRMMTLRKPEIMCEEIAILKMEALSYIYIYIYIYIYKQLHCDLIQPVIQLQHTCTINIFGFPYYPLRLSRLVHSYTAI